LSLYIRGVEKEKLPLWKERNDLRTQAEDFAAKTAPCVEREMKTQRCKFMGIIGLQRIEKMEKMAEEAVVDIINLCQGTIGVDYSSDKVLRTNFSVFTVLGYHSGDYGDCEVLITLKREVMYHPDFNLTTQAATSYCAEKCNWCHSGFFEDRTDWMGANPMGREEGLSLFRKERYSPAVKGWDEDFAREWICRAYGHRNCKCGAGKHAFKATRKNAPIPPPVSCRLYGQRKLLNQIDMEDVHQLFLSFPLFGSHLAPEGHAPGIIPLSYIDKIIIQKRKYDELMALKNPTVDAFFQEFRSKNPGNFITVDGDPKDIIYKMHDTLWGVSEHQTLLPTSPTGFTFTVSPSCNYNVEIPLKITFKKPVVSFSVVGGSFSLYLSNFPNVIDSDDSDRCKNMIYVFFDHLSGEITTRSIKGATETVGPSCQLYGRDSRVFLLKMILSAGIFVLTMKIIA